jgi:hypothetical protein
MSQNNKTPELYCCTRLLLVDLKGFWRWCMLYRTIWLLLDSIHRLVCGSFTKDHWVGLPCPIHLRTETGPVSETLWSFVKLPHTRRWIGSKRSQIVLYNIFYFFTEWYSVFVANGKHVFWLLLGLFNDLASTKGTVCTEWDVRVTMNDQLEGKWRGTGRHLLTNPLKHEKMVVVQLVKKIPPLMRSEGSLPLEEHHQITEG